MVAGSRTERLPWRCTMDGSPELLTLLNKAVAREIQVSIQYMLQHAICGTSGLIEPGVSTDSKRRKFIGRHLPVWLPGSTLKNFAITEMRHAEAIAERLLQLGAEPTTVPDEITLGKTPTEMLAINKEAEAGAISLYNEIMGAARNQKDDRTAKLFETILRDEQSHHRVFSRLLEED